MTADTAANRTCRNTIVVLITGGKDSGDAAYTAAHNAATTATSFLSVTGERRHQARADRGRRGQAGGRRRGVAPDDRHQQRRRLSQCHDRVRRDRGGRLRRAARLRAVGRLRHRHGERVHAGQPDRRHGQPEERRRTPPATRCRTPTSPRIPAASTCRSAATSCSPPASRCPGSTASLRAFRTYKPVADSTKPTGWKFVNDGTRLWPDLDGRPCAGGQGAHSVWIRTRATSIPIIPERQRRRIGGGVHHGERRDARHRTWARTRRPQR